jgi:hypothetical protein
MSPTKEALNIFTYHETKMLINGNVTQKFNFNNNLNMKQVIFTPY